MQNGFSTSTDRQIQLLLQVARRQRLPIPDFIAQFAIHYAAARRLENLTRQVKVQRGYGAAPTLKLFNQFILSDVAGRSSCCSQTSALPPS